MGDQHVGVQVRVASPAAAVLEGGSDEAVRLYDRRSTMAAPDAAGEVLQGMEGSPDRFVVGGADLGGDLRRAEGIEQRHRLRGEEGGVVADDPRRLVGQPCPRRRITAVEDGIERLGVQFTREAEQLGAPAHAPPRQLPDAGVVLVEASSDGVGVVRLWPA